MVKFLLRSAFVMFFLCNNSFANNDLLKQQDDETSSEIRFDGRIMADSQHIIKGKTSNTQNAAAIRRAWLGFGGNIGKNWDYRGLFGFENDEAEIIDSFIAYKGFKDSEILIGNFFENNGLDANTPNLVNPLMERSAAFSTFRKLRRAGASYNYYQQDYAVKFGVFGPSINKTKLEDRGEGVSGRAYYLPINDMENGHYLHVGFNASYRTPESINNTLRYKSSGNSWVIDENIINSGVMRNVNNHQHYSPEVRYQNGAFSATAEYFKTIINRNSSDLSFDSSYVLMSYFLTGQQYEYGFKNGAPIDVINKEGAIEVATRYSNVDMNNKDVRGGKLNSYDLGVNYYPKDNLKFMLNYTYNKLKESPMTNKNPQHIMMRAQLWF